MDKGLGDHNDEVSPTYRVFRTIEEEWRIRPLTTAGRTDKAVSEKAISKGEDILPDTVVTLEPLPKTLVIGESNKDSPGQAPKVSFDIIFSTSP